ncbi:MAG: VOC family protein [Ancalomicrobiaceae bacterium]|nr:VOC family protein [Ancalomicrobiaceae bacterium]
MKDGSVIQIAHVVRNLDEAMKAYHETLGMGPWNVYKFAPPDVRDSEVNGKPSDHAYWLAVTWRDGIQFELIQPGTGRSIYDDFLDKHGEGLHHLKLYYTDCAKALADYTKRGFKIIQSGKFDEDEFYYLDTEKTLGYVIELGNNGKIREPLRRYPA